jgi:uncharacterized membrane protein
MQLIEGTDIVPTNNPNRFLARLIFILVVTLSLPLAVAADSGTSSAPPKEDVWEGVVSAILEEGDTEALGEPQHYQFLEVTLSTGPQRDRVVSVEHVAYALTDLQRYHEGQRVMVVRVQEASGSESFYVAGPVRRGALTWMFLAFVVAVVATGRRQGAFALVGMAFSFAVIVLLILPRIAAGHDPVMVAIIGSALTVPVSFYLSHGVNRKTTVAVIGTAIALVITGLLARLFVESAYLTGYASEEAGFLQVTGIGAIDVKALLLAGIIVGVLGVLDDVTISQAAVVQQLKAANPLLPFGQLFRRAMAVGRDHIASMVNTLVLVYAGAAMPLLLLLSDSPQPFWQLINYEIIAEEIVRMLVASLGLIAAVPITTFLASLAMIDASIAAQETTPHRG